MLLQPLLASLAEGYIVITPTQRLAREILFAYSQESAEFTPKPACYAYDTWLNKWFKDLQFHQSAKTFPCLINNFQLEILWQHISEHRLNPHECKLELSALKNCSLAAQIPTGSAFLYTPEAEVFSQKYQKLKSYLQHHQLLADFELAKFLEQQSYPTKCKGMIWAFFDCFHPQQQKLQEALNKRGIQQDVFEFASPLSPAKSHYQYHAETISAEHQQIIAWTKSALNMGHQRIGIIFPDLSQHQEALKRAFKFHFSEDILHFSLGKGLQTFPLLQQALSFLRLSKTKAMSRTDYTCLLLSPYIQGYTEEAEARAACSRHGLCQEPQLFIRDFLKLLHQQAPCLAQALSKVEDYPKKQSPKSWIKHFAARLDAFGFPASTYLDPENMQALKAFYTCLERLNEATIIEENLSEEQAFSALESLIQNEIIQAPQNHEGIHIMGWLESSGFIGDALWIAHLDSQNLPQGIKYSPYLPIDWQKKHKLPRTSRETEFEISNNMLTRLIHAHQHQHLVLSCARHNDAGEPLWPSVLIPELNHLQTLETQATTQELEIIEETWTLPLQPGQILKGGSQLLSAQAKCPFSAFAQYRLNHQQKSEASFGFNPFERGNLTHRALQLIWEQLQNQATLLSMSEDEEANLIASIAHQSLKEFSINRPYSMDKMLYKLEHHQLSHMIKSALDLDKTREPFIVSGLEQRIKLQIDDWPFELRYDRLDTLENGKSIVIDYKSSIPQGAPWNQDRPLNPQLLMYALAEPNIHGMLYFAINQTGSQYKGISACPSTIKGIQYYKKDWNESRETWLNQIHDLISEIKQGHIAAQPTHASQCGRCIHRDICRKEHTEPVEE